VTWHGEDAPRRFPPNVVVAIKALACELPATTGVPLARWHCPDLARAAVQQGIACAAGHRRVDLPDDHLAVAFR
jgi:hypothetical protein